MITIHYQRQLPYPPARLLAQYFDLEHLEHVHPRSFGKARLVSQHQNVVIWDLEQPPLLGIVRFRNRIRQHCLASDHISATVLTGFLRGSTTDTRLTKTETGTLLEEEHMIPLPSWPLLRRGVQKWITRKLDTIWEEDLRVGVCCGGWPGVPRFGFRRA